MELDLNTNISKSDLATALKVLATLGGGLTNTQRNVMIKEGIEQYESNAENNLSPKSLLSIKCTNKPFLKFFSAIRTLNTITQHDIEKYIAHIRKNAPKGYKVYVRTLRAMFNKFKEWNYVAENPLDKIKLPRVQKVKEDYLSADDVKYIVDSAENVVIKNVIVFAYNTGMRLSEIVFLNWTEVDLKKRIITVGSHQFVCKSKKIRFIPMNDTVYQLL